MTGAKPFLGKPGPFSQAYPEVKSLRARVLHRGDLAYATQREQTFTEHSIPEVVPCPNPRCQQGGYNLRAIMIALAHGKMPSYSAKFSCHGHEGTPKGRKIGDPCCNSIELEIETTFNG